MRRGGRPPAASSVKGATAKGKPRRPYTVTLRLQDSGDPHKYAVCHVIASSFDDAVAKAKAEWGGHAPIVMEVEET